MNPHHKHSDSHPTGIFELRPPGASNPRPLACEARVLTTRLPELWLALQCGVSANMVASHSLRRGGATTYSLHVAGVPDEDIKRFGRWLSDAYKLYVFLGMGSIMSKGQSNPMVVVPRFERN